MIIIVLISSTRYWEGDAVEYGWAPGQTRPENTSTFLNAALPEAGNGGTKRALVSERFFTKSVNYEGARPYVLMASRIGEQEHTQPSLIGRRALALPTSSLKTYQTDNAIAIDINIPDMILKIAKWIHELLSSKRFSTLC